MESFLLFLLNEKPNVSPSTIKLGLPHKSSIATVRNVQKVHLLENLFCDGLRTLTNMRGQKMYRGQEDLQHCPIKSKESVFILFDTQADLCEDQSKIHQYHGAQFMTDSKTDYKCFRTDFKSYSNWKTVTVQLVWSVQTGACKIYRRIHCFQIK